MGIILGALSGAGKGLANVGQHMMQSAEEKEREQRRMQFEQQLMKDRAAIEMKQQENLAKLKQTLAEEGLVKRHDRIREAAGGIVGGQFDAAKKAYENAPDITDEQRQMAYSEIDKNREAAMHDPAVMKQAALMSGDYETADVLGKLGERKTANVATGSTMVDEATGEVIFDNSAEYKQALLQRSSGTGKGGVGKGDDGLTAYQRQQKNEKVLKRIEEDYESKPHPFNTAMVGEDPEPDVKRQRTIRNLVEVAAEQGADAGQIYRQLEPVADDFDRQISALARQRAKEVFAKDMEDTDRQQLIASGIPESALVSEKHFAKFLRDREFTQEKLGEFYRANSDKYNGRNSKGAVAKEMPKQDTSKAEPKKSDDKPKSEQKGVIQREAKKAEPEKSFAERQREAVSARQKASEDKDIKALEEKRRKALRDGKPVDANRYISEINRIQKERYGF